MIKSGRYKRKVYRKSKIPRSIFNECSVRCECSADIYIENGTSTVVFGGNNATEMMFITLLNSYSASWGQQIARFTQYKIVSVSATAYRLYSDSFVNGLFTDYAMGPVYLVPYPSLALTNFSIQPLGSDQTLTIPAFQSVSRTKKWSYAGKRALTGTCGLGTWNASLYSANQMGQFSLGDNVGTASKRAILYTIRLHFHCLFRNLSQ